MILFDRPGSFEQESDKICAQIRVIQLSIERDLGSNYEKLDNQFEVIINNIKKTKQINENTVQILNNLLENYRVEFLVNLCDYLLDVIFNKRKNTQDFGDLITELEGIRKKVKQTSLTDNEFEDLYYELIPKLSNRIKYRLEVDVNTKRLFWNGIWIGALIGFILGIIGSIVVSFLGF